MADQQSASPAPVTQANTATPATKSGIEIGDKDGVAPSPVEMRELSEQDLDAYVSKKVNGKVEKIKVRDALAKAQLAEATEKKYIQAKASAKEFETVRAQMGELQRIAKSDPRKFFEIIGVDPYEFSEATLTEKLKLMEMSPEARENQTLKQRLAEKEAREAEQKEEANRHRMSQEEKRYAQSLDKELGDAFKASSLPHHKFYVQQVAAHLIACESQDEPCTPQEAVEAVQHRTQSHMRELISGMETNQLREFLGEENLKKLREDDVKRFQNQDAPKKASGTPTQAPRKNNKPFTSDREYRDWVDSLKTA